MSYTTYAAEIEIEAIGGGSCYLDVNINIDNDWIEEVFIDEVLTTDKLMDLARERLDEKDLLILAKDIIDFEE